MGSSQAFPFMREKRYFGDMYETATWLDEKNQNKDKDFFFKNSDDELILRGPSQ